MNLPRLGRTPIGDIPYVDVVSPRRRWTSRLLLPALGGVLAGLIAWFAWTDVLQPRRDRALFEQGAAELRAEFGKQNPGWFEVWDKGGPEQRYIGYARSLAGHKHPEAAQAAFRLAMREGSAEAHLLYGIELAKGSFGPKDLEQALRHYRKALELTETGVQVSDPDALYVRAHQLHGGYGVPVQRDAARNAAARAAEQLTSWRANELAQAAAWGWAPFERREPDIATTLLDKGLLSRDPKTYILGLSSCRGLSDEMRAGVDSAYQRCSKHWYRKGAEAGAVSAMGSHAENLLRAGEDLTLALRYLRQGHTENTPDQRLLEPLVAYMVGKGDPRMLLDEAWVVLGQNRNAGSEFVAASLWDTAGTVVLLAPFTEARLSPESLRTLGQMLRMLADRAGTSANTRRAISDFGGGAAPALLAGFDSAAQRRAAITQVPPAVVQAPARDREQQDKTGYVPGEPRAAAGGLSVFTVDNAQGSGDAIARLYLEGRKPAVRSFFVKHGEKFTASGLRAGSYVMRYRYMGSEDTYEADRVFALTEEKTDRGTRYSRITVTLYKVTDGNLQTKKVPPEQF